MIKQLENNMKEERNKGINNPMFGKHHTEEARNKIREARLGKKMPEWHKEIMRKKAIENNPMKNKEVAVKVSTALKGKIFSEEHRKNISLSKIGIPSWNKGKHRYWISGTRKGHKFGPMNEEHREKIREAFIGKNKGMIAWNKGKTFPEYSGENNPAWLGGKSFEPYTKDFNKSFKEAIKQRDGFMCLKCGLREEDNKKLFNHSLNVHHINYDKNLSIKENCCSLYTRCHIETNTNRESWKKFYQSLLSERYGYKYSEDGLPIINIVGGKI